MRLIGLVCVIAYCVVATVVAIRMLRLAGRTGGLPELFIGSALFLGGVVGFPPLVTGPLLAPAQPGLALHLGLAAILGLHLSGWANLLAWRTIFHPGARWSRNVAVVCSAALFVSVVHRLSGVAGAYLQGDRSGEVGATYAASLVVQASPYALMTVSAFRYRAKLARRLALGLADPVVVNRIGLWAMTSAAVVVQYAFALATISARSVPAVAAAYQIVISGLGLALSVLLYLAFLPPKTYLRRIATRGGAPAPLEAA